MSLLGARQPFHHNGIHIRSSPIDCPKYFLKRISAFSIGCSPKNMIGIRISIDVNLKSKNDKQEYSMLFLLFPGFT